MRAHRVGRSLAAAALAVGAVLPLAAPGVAQDLETVKRQREQLTNEIDETLTTLEELEVRIIRTRQELAELEERTAELAARGREANEALEIIARQAFKRGEVSAWDSLLGSNGPTAALEKARLLAALSRRDVTTIESSEALQVQIAQSRTLLAAKTAELAELEAQMEEHAATLQSRFRRVDETYQELKTRKERQVQLANGAQSGTYACIFNGGYRYRNTWGAPRSGGRSHEGTDVFSYYGAPVYAFTDGVIQRYSNSTLGGIGLYLWGDDGVQYYYAHLKGYAAGIFPGKRVEAGQLVGYNGASGNADMSAPHVHFEVHPGGGGPVNPYHWLVPVCR